MNDVSGAMSSLSSRTISLRLGLSVRIVPMKLDIRFHYIRKVLVKSERGDDMND